MRILYKQILITSIIVILCILPIEFFTIQKSQKIISDKTSEICQNMANNIVTIARDELFLNNVYQDTANLLKRISKSKLKALKNIYIINVYGKYVVEMIPEKKGNYITSKELDLLKGIDKATLKEINTSDRKILRYTYPVFLDTDQHMRIGMVILDFDKNKLYQPVYDIERFIFILGGAIFALAILLSILTSFLMTRPISNLSEGVAAFAGGDLKYRIENKSSDEIGRLARSFNIMADNLEKADILKQSYITTYEKFVPTEFVTFLDKQSILDIRLGNQVQREMTVLFSDIRSFTSLSEELKPEENFNFINSYLNRMGPIVRKYGGFIDKYIGDAIMALFPNSANDAVNAAIEMQKEMATYNIHRKKTGYRPIEIGIGLHTGTLMLGIIGENKRMEGTVISDSVNLASRLETLTKVYSSAIIISESTFSKLDDLESYHFRMLGNVTVKGKKEEVAIFEILDFLPKDKLKLRYNYKADFERAILLYHINQYDQALGIWQEIAQKNPNDKTINYYIGRCMYIIEHGVEQAIW